VIIHRYNDDPSATHGAPEVTAAVFLGLFAFLLLFPLAGYSLEGMGSAKVALSMLRTDFGFNIFALVLLLTPLLGILIAMLHPPIWRVATTVLAVLGAVMVPLAIFWFGRGLGHAAVPAHVFPEAGTYLVLPGFVLLALMDGVPLFLHRSQRRARKQHAANG